MRYYKIVYTINDKNERVYPKKMKGVVFTVTQDHATEPYMVAGTEAAMDADGKTIFSLTEKEAQAMVKELMDSFPKPESPAGAPFPPPPPPPGQ